MTETNTQRRKPKQARSLQRYETMLDAAEELMLETGYDAMTTNAIAARAEVSIGSLYQYFPNKDALLSALAERYIERRKAMNTRVLDQNVIAGLSLLELTDHWFDPLVAFYEENPAVLYIYLGADVSPEMAVAYADLDRESIATIHKIVQFRAPHLSEERAGLVAISIKAMIKALLGLMFNTPDSTRRGLIIAEFKQMLLAYMTTVETKPA